MQINKIDDINCKKRFVDIIYKNFLGLKNENVNHTKEEIKRQLFSVHSNSFYIINNNKIAAYIIAENIVISDGRFTCFIYYLYVSSKHRNNGYSTKLLNLLEKECVQYGIPSIMLLVRKNNIIAKNIYYKNRFIREQNNDLNQNSNMLLMIKYL